MESNFSSPPGEQARGTLEKWSHHVRRQNGATFMQDLRPGLELTLDLSVAHPGGVARLYAGRPTKLSSLLREQTVALRGARLTKTLLQLQEDSLQKYGSNPLQLVSGVASWSQLPTQALNQTVQETAEGAPKPPPAETQQNEDTTTLGLDLRPGKVEHYYCPVLLRPVWIEPEKDSDYTFTLGQSLTVNPVLIKQLARRALEIDPAQITNLVMQSGEFAPHLGLEQLRELGTNHLPGFELREEILIAPTWSVSQILKNDYDHWQNEIEKHPVVLALAGDKKTAQELRVKLPPDTGQDREPGQERGITDLDPSQSHAVECVAAGAHLFIDLPPGAPTAPTVAAILADAAASGRKVAYVPGVHRRGVKVAQILKQNRLDSAVLNLLDTPHWVENFFTQTRQSLNPQPVTLDIEYLRSQSQQLAQAREKLQTYTMSLHTKRDPWGVSAYDALQALADLTSAKPGPRTKVRINFADKNAATASAAGRHAARAALQAAQEAGILDVEHIESPWKGAVISTVSAASAAIERVERLQAQLPRLRENLSKVVEQTGLVAAPHLAAWAEQIEMLSGVRSVLDVFRPEIFERSAADMVIATATKQWRKDRSFPMTWRTRRSLTRQARDLLRPGISPKGLHADLVKVQNHRDVWRRHALPGAWPRIPEDFAQLLELSQAIFTDIKELQNILGTSRVDLQTMPFAQLEAHLGALSDASGQAKSLPTEIKLLGDLHDLGLDPLLADLRARKVPASLALAELDLAWWSGILATILASDSLVGGYDGPALRDLAQTWRELDQAQVANLPGPVRGALAGRAGQALEREQDLAQNLYRYLDPALNTDPAQLVEAFPALGELLPICLASAVVLSQLFRHEKLDLLVLDHLDEIPPWQLAPLLARARQVVVCGDARRPWSGFTRQAAKILPRVTVTSDASALPEQVAVFLSEHGYGEVIRPVPAPAPASLVKLVTVDGRAIQTSGRGAGVPARAEVAKVVALAVEHAQLNPDASLAVVCLNPEAVPLIESALAQAVSRGRSAARSAHAEGLLPPDSPSGEAVAAWTEFFSAPSPEPFVVTDSTKAAGLRRDVLILCVGVAKSNHGKVVHDFGTVSTPAGAAYLVDALEVARKELVVTSSFRAEEVDPARATQLGPQMLVDLLSQAGNPTGMTRALLTGASFESEPDRLLVDLAERLWRRGLTVVPRFGLPQGVKVPLAIGHADLPTELLVAVLSDDENYVAEPSLRRKERYWHQRLTAAGWEVVTVYSPQVFADPQGQADAVQSLVEQVVARRLAAQQEKQNRKERQDRLEQVARQARSGVRAVTGATSQNSGDTEASPAEGSAPVAAAPGEGGEQSTQRVSENAGPAQSTEGQSGSDGPPAANPGTPEEPDKNTPSDDQTASKTGAQLELVAARGPRPPIAPGLPLSAYGDDQLDELFAWVCSDGLDRSEDEQVEQLRAALDLTRRGAQVDAVLRNVVRRRARSLAEETAQAQSAAEQATTQEPKNQTSPGNSKK